MRAQHTFGLSLSWTRVTTVFLIDVAILRLASQWPDQFGTAARAWWPGVGLAVLVAATTLITHRRVPLTSVLAARIFDRFADPAAWLTEGRTAAFDHRRRYSREVVGVREYRGLLVTVLAVEQPLETAGRHSRGPLAAPALPAGLVAASLRQFDVRLDGIDIVSVRTRDVDDGDEDPADDAATADTPAPTGPDGTWLILRMDPMRNDDAVAVRDSVASTISAATERLAHDLNERRIATRVVRADEFDQVDAAVLAGLQPTRIRRRGRRLKQKARRGPKHYAASFWMSPRDITSANLERLWLPTAGTTAVTVRLATRHSRTEMSVLVRYHSANRLRRNAWAGLNRFNGRQLTALRSSLPTPMRRTLAVPARSVNGRESLQVPLVPTG